MHKETTTNILGQSLANSIQKRAPMQPVKRYQYDFNTSSEYKRRPDNSVQPEVLRRFSVTHEISRICINTRKRQISQLDWDIVATDSKRGQLNRDNKDVELVKQYFKHLAGPTRRFRWLQDVAIEDLLTLDAITLYKQRDAAGRLLYVKPVDAATVKIVVDEYGDTPVAPDIAYRQYIRGKLQAEFTADDLIYDLMNPRTTTPYGLAPLESLILIVSSALRAELFNLDYLTFENIPEGLLEMPENWGVQMISEFQSAWDALLAGNGEINSKLRVVPSGTKYSATKKPDEMAFAEFNTWLMQITCAMFDVQPHEIGFTDTVNKSNGKEQSDITTRKALLPLTQMLKEIWDTIIQDELGFKNLEFRYLGLEDRDSLLDAQTDEIELRSGMISIDEKRIERGLEPIGVNTPYVLSGRTLNWITPGIDVNPETSSTDPGQSAAVEPKAKPKNNEGTPSNRANTTIQGDYHPATDQPNSNNSVATADTPQFTKSVPAETNSAHIEHPSSLGDGIKSELKKFQTFATKRLKDGKTYRNFESEVLDSVYVAELNARAEKAANADDIKKAVQVVSKLAKQDGDFEEQAGDNKTLKALYVLSGFIAFRDLFKKGLHDQYTVLATKLDAYGQDVKDIPTFLDQNLPALDVSKSEVYDWFREATNTSVNQLYKDLGINKEFTLTENAYKRVLEDDATFLLEKSTLDDTTKKNLFSIITRGIDDNLNPQELSQLIKDKIPGITETRANLIAQTETANIASKAQFEAFRRMGVEMKEWVAYGPDPCPICMANSGDGLIPIDSMFSSGDLMPSAHPRCECALDTQTLDINDAMIESAWDGSGVEE